MACPNLERGFVFSPIDLKAPHIVKTILSNIGTPVLFSKVETIPAPAKLVHKMITASAPSEITSSAASAILD